MSIVDDQIQILKVLGLQMKPEWKGGPMAVATLLEGASKAWSYKDAILLADKAYETLGRWIYEYAQGELDGNAKKNFTTFATMWKRYRLCIGLQTRLMAEQVLYDLGQPWRNLVSGFKPIQ